jgi:hypothetical protein
MIKMITIVALKEGLVLEDGCLEGLFGLQKGKNLGQ